MESKISNPHDKFFKAVFSNEQHAKDFLSLYLPDELLKTLDFSTLRIIKDSFVEKELKEYFSDLLYQVKLKNEPVYIYCLFEHKSYPDRFTGFQLLRYMTKIWEQIIQQSRARGSLPIIVPMVIYHGTTPWKAGTKFNDLFEISSDYLQRYIPDFTYHLYDISHLNDDEIKGAVLLRATLLTMKYIFSPDLRKHLDKIFGIFQDLISRKTGLEYLEILLRYLVNASDLISREDIERALKSIPEGEKIMPTIAEEWKKEGFEQGIQKGIQQGIQKGIQQGIQKGIREGLLEAVELGLKLKFGTKGLKIYPRIRKLKEVDQLRSIKEAIEVAKDLSEIEELI